MIVEINIPIPSYSPGNVVATARALRKFGFEQTASKVCIRRATRSRLLVVRADYTSSNGVNGALRALARELRLEQVSAAVGRGAPVYRCTDCDTPRDGMPAEGFVRLHQVANIEGVAEVAP